MIIPTTSGPSPYADVAQPSETNLLMALATMHAQGRFAKPDTNKKLQPKEPTVGQ